jgi:Na+/proline symporter
MLGLSGCSSYIDIGGTMAMVGAVFYLGLKSLWATHIFRAWFIMCFYMAFQAKWIRRSGVMTFAEWNENRFGRGRDAEAARIAAAMFLLILMICNLMNIAIGTGKFAEEFLPFTRWESALIVFAGSVLEVLAGFSWVIFRVLAEPNVWNFQLFLTTKSPREASLAGGMWTVGYTLRWIIGCAFMILGIHYFGSQAGFDAEKIMPLVLTKLSAGMPGFFIAILLAALMSTMSAMTNVTGSVVINDFAKRYLVKNISQKQLVRLGQAASVLALALGFIFSLSFSDAVTAWEAMIFVVVTMILIAATLRWHYWRFSATALVWAMFASACLTALQKIFFAHWSPSVSLAANTLSSFAATVIISFLSRPAEMDILVRFYSKARPFGIWRPVRREAARRVLVPDRDPMPAADALNGVLTIVFKFSLALVPFYFLLRKNSQFFIWLFTAFSIGVILYFT